MPVEDVRLKKSEQGMPELTKAGGFVLLVITSSTSSSGK
jgi:hypothetical protein